MTRPSHQSLDLSHKWYAIVLSSLSDFRSTKEKIQESVLIKEHCLKAIELHGKGAHSRHGHNAINRVDVSSALTLYLACGVQVAIRR